MKVARILLQGEETFALVNSEGKMSTRDEIVKKTGLRLPHSLDEFVFGGSLQKMNDRTKDLTFAHEIGKLKILPPFTKSFKIICLAFNYSDQDSWVRFGKFPPREPVIYLKPHTSLVGPFDDIVCPKFVTQLDYEGELAFVIGKKCKDVSEKDSIDCVAGYFVMNDVSARDIQFIDKQYTRAKGFDTFGPCGPWLTTPDEVPDPHNLSIITKVNGEIRQNSSTSNMVLKVNKIIHSLSLVMTLEPGDIISTGTPSGTVLSLSSHLKYLQQGDIVEVEVGRLGRLRNRVVFS
ncbi:MAG: fumarylacetoacetate hydrolase family protein [Thaumarchaeota archaeon]|nr:MAG: fumarylacetoacetate hydrolase family protein [Nitrososphaerota archaeon]